MNTSTRKTILLVEDEALIAMSEKTGLEKYGYSVRTLSTGEQAVEAVQKSPDIDLILMDIDLGSGIDDTEAAEIILKDRDIPIVFLSSHTDPEVVGKTEKITSYGYVVKNSSLAVLDASIKMAFKLFAEKTVRKEAEKELRNSRHLYSCSIEALPYPFALINADTHEIELANTVFGKDDAVNMTCYRYLYDKGTPCNDQTHPCPIDQLKRTRRAVTVQHEYQDRQGKPCYVEISTYPIFDDDGRLDRITECRIDVTERKQMEAALREEGRRNAEAFQLISGILESSQEVVIFALDTEYRYLTFNAKHRATMKGIWHAEIEVGKNMLDYITDPVDRDTAKSNFDRALNGESFTITEQYGDTALDRRWYANSYGPLYDSEGGVIGLTLFLSDITELKRAEEALRGALNEAENGKRTLEALMEHIPVGVTIADANLRLLQVSRHGLEMMGWPVDRHIGLSVEEILDEWEVYMADGITKARVEELPLPRAIMNGETVFGAEIVQRHADGRIIPLACDAGPIKDTEGRITGGIIAWQDVTKRKQAEEALRTAEQRLEKTAYELTESIPVGTYTMVQPPGGGMAKFEFMSRRFLEISGLVEIREEAASDPLKAFVRVHPDEFDNWVALNAKAFEEKKPFYGETRLIVHGEIRWISAESVPRVLPDGSTVWEGVVTDITERKQAEQEIQRQLDEKEILLKEVHHRIKNNMAQVESLLSLQADSADDTRVTTALNEAISRVRSTRILYEKLLVDTDQQKVSMKGYLDSIIESHAEVYNDHAGVSIEKSIVDFSLSSKKAILIGIIVNELLTNVFKYAFKNRDEGHVLIKLEKTESRITLVVQDNGIGFDSRVAANKTTGFGLTLTKMLAEQLGGTFSVKNENGTQSVVEFDL